MKRRLLGKFKHPRFMLRGLAAAIAAIGASVASAADTAVVAPQAGTIGYVLTNLYWTMYQTPDGKTECPKGFNDGPREQYYALFPASGKKPKLVDAQLMLESETWHPTNSLKLPALRLVEGPNAYGMNLDGKVGPEDFTHPDGEKGIDNELYRALGCIIGFRGPDGVEYIFENEAIARDRFNRIMIELSGVDDLNNDGDVQVTMYRGLDRLVTDASGNNIVPGGTQRIDTRWGAKLMRQTRGRIVDAVLTTEPLSEVVIPWENFLVPSLQIVRDMRFQLKVSPSGAQGLIAGYVDVDTWYKQLLRNDSTHHLGDGQISGLSLYQALRRLADAHPDPRTGSNTAISAALDAKFTQVFIQHPQGDAAKAELLRDLSLKVPAAERRSRADPTVVRPGSTTGKCHLHLAWAGERCLPGPTRYSRRRAILSPAIRGKRDSEPAPTASSNGPLDADGLGIIPRAAG